MVYRIKDCMVYRILKWCHKRLNVVKHMGKQRVIPRYAALYYVLPRRSRLQGYVVFIEALGIMRPFEYKGQLFLVAPSSVLGEGERR